MHSSESRSYARSFWQPLLASGALDGVYLALHGAVPGGVAAGRGSFTIDQGVEMGRPSELEATVLVEGELPVGVRVEGSAVLVMRGELDV